MDKQTLITSIGVGSLAFGVAGVLAPGTLLGTYGADASPSARFMTRLWGSRNLVLGALTLQLEGKARDTLLQLAVGMNALDAVVGLLSPVLDDSPNATAIAAAATSGAFAGVGAYAASLS